MEELCVQLELARDALTIPWHLRWMALLVQWLSWDPLRASNVQMRTDPTSAVSSSLA